MNKIEYKDLIAFHPGYYVKDFIEDQGITQQEFAIRLQTSAKNVSALINGKTQLADDMAQRLAIVFGTSTTLWLNLSAKYIEKKLEIERLRQLENESVFLNYLN